MKNLFTIALLVVISVFSSPISGQWVKNVIDENVDMPTSLTPGDIDGDGDEDIDS